LGKGKSTEETVERQSRRSATEAKSCCRLTEIHGHFGSPSTHAQIANLQVEIIDSDIKGSDDGAVAGEQTDHGYGLLLG
jgi:hypothetical protein